MTTIDTSGRPGYMYDEATTTWYAISGRVSTSANYVWTGAQQFDNNSIFAGAITAKLKFNCFLNPAARTAAIPSPSVGLLTFIQQNAGGATVNRFEFWNGSACATVSDPSATETLTNKTISGADNTLSNIPQSAVTGLASTISGLASTYAPLNITLNQQTASYTLVLTDNSKQVEISNGSANTLTVPPASSVNFPIGSVIVITQTGAGQTTVTPGSGVTINYASGLGLKLRAQWSSATLTKRASDTWLLTGDISA